MRKNLFHSRNNKKLPSAKRQRQDNFMKFLFSILQEIKRKEQKLRQVMISGTTKYDRIAKKL